MHLVPFGERTPYRDVIPFLGSIDWTKWTGDLGPAEFSPGVERKLFDHPKGKLGTLICFESVVLLCVVLVSFKLVIRLSSPSRQPT